MTSGLDTVIITGLSSEIARKVGMPGVVSGSGAGASAPAAAPGSIPRSFSGRCHGSTTLSVVAAATYSITLRSSRTLPSQR